MYLRSYQMKIALAVVVGVLACIIQVHAEDSPAECNETSKTPCSRPAPKNERERIVQKQELELECRTKGIPLNRCVAPTVKSSSTKESATTTTKSGAGSTTTTMRAVR